MEDNAVRASIPKGKYNTPAQFLKTALLWNTYAGDLHWFRFSVASFSKFARGRFNMVACFVPTRHRDQFREVCEQHEILLFDRPDWQDKSFNWHQMWQCQADMLFPHAGAIWHMDADTVFAAPCGPEDWMSNGKLICPYVSFDHLLAGGGRFGTWQWKSRVDDALGGDAKIATMTGHPHCHYRNVYAKTREEVARHTHSWEKYIHRQQNSFPQGFCEFETLGAIAHRFYHNDYVWRDLQTGTHPSIGRTAQCLSHGGLDGLHQFPEWLGGTQTPRQLFQRIGL